MKAVCWHGKKNVRVDTVRDPSIQEDTDIIVRVTATSICGSDLHIYNGYVPEMKAGDILGHEFIGEVVEVGVAVKNLVKGDRVVVPCMIACGSCDFCARGEWALCDHSNPRAGTQRDYHGTVTSGVFGYSAIYGAFPGGQAEFVRVPHADVGPLKIKKGISDEQALLLTDVFPTAYMAAENAGVKPGSTVAVWGCGPVGQLVIMSAKMHGAGRVIAIDRVAERLDLAKKKQDAETIDFTKTADVVEELRNLTGGDGPHCCIDAVGMEAYGSDIRWGANRLTEALGLQSDHPVCVQQAITACRKGGTVSIVGAYAGTDSLPLGIAFAKGLTIRMGPVHAHRYMRPLMEKIEQGQGDPSFIVSHRLPLEEAPMAYEMFDKKEDGCVKVVMSPGQ